MCNYCFVPVTYMFFSLSLVLNSFKMIHPGVEFFAISHVVVTAFPQLICLYLSPNFGIILLLVLQIYFSESHFSPCRILMTCILELLEWFHIPDPFQTFQTFSLLFRLDGMYSIITCTEFLLHHIHSAVELILWFLLLFIVFDSSKISMWSPILFLSLMILSIWTLFQEISVIASSSIFYSSCFKAFVREHNICVISLLASIKCLFPCELIFSWSYVT